MKRIKRTQLMLGFSKLRRDEVEKKVKGHVYTPLIYILRTQNNARMRPLLMTTRMAIRINFKPKP